MLLKALATLLAVTAQTAHALDPLTFKGSKIFRSDGSQFFIKGIAYQLTPDDPLADVDQCTQDANLMSTLGTNSIRVYHVNPYLDHSGCMSVFADAGIYVWLDLDTFNTTIEQTDPTWTVEQFSAFATVMDVFAQFDNIAGFWIGNEVITSRDGSPAAPYVKAAITDLKAYRDSKGYRDIPIGYSAADIAELRPMLQNYLACGDSASSVEFFGLNSYEWCGDVTFETSGYQNLNNDAEGYPKPIFFSETGCITVRPRTFGDQDSILGPDMDSTWSGAMIYEWIQEANDYGLITYPGDGTSGTPTPIEPDFPNLSSRWATLSPTGVSSDAYTATESIPECPAATAGGWAVDGDVAIPSLGVAALTAQPSITPVTVSHASSTTIVTADSEVESLSASTSNVAQSTTTATSTNSGSTSSSTSASASSSSTPNAAAFSTADLPRSLTSFTMFMLFGLFAF